MAQLARDALVGALTFAEARLREFAVTACASPDGLADAFALPHAAAAAPAVATHLANARSQLDLARAALVARDEKAAAARLAVFLTTVESALGSVAWPGANPGLPGVFERVRARGAAAAGLVRQLGLPALPSTPAGLALKDGFVVFAVGSDAPATMAGPGGARLRLGPRALTARLRLTGAAGPAFSVSLAVRDAGVSTGGDLVGAMAGAGGEVSADLVVGMDTDRGLTVGGTPNTRVSLPARPSFGAVDVRGLVLEVPAGDPDAFDLGASVAARLGPATGVIDGAGVRAHIDPAGVGAGVSPLSVTLLAPSGLGLSLETGFVAGGGYMSRRGPQFGGSFDLRLGPIGVHGVGLLTLGGEAGFALVIVMSIEFFPAIEIAFGFTLNAVGGLVGIQRAIDTDALAESLANRALDHLLFPKDATSAAPAILDTLATTFPVLRGGFVVGPMLKLGWGRPISFATASLGVVLSFPGPRIVILGLFRLAVPAPDVALIDLKAAVFGEISGERILLIAALVDSRIGALSVAGGIGILVRYGASPELAFSAGGFHPRFLPPPELKNLQRLSMDLSPPAGLRLRAEAYVALTSNSLQAGARVELSAEVGPINAHGHLEFDALIRFQPFQFEVDVGAGVCVRYSRFTIAGVDLHLHLEGPAPWRARGTGTFTVLGIDKDIDIGPIEWGPKRPAPPPLAHPQELIHAALSNAASWQSQIPEGAERLVRLRETPGESSLVHPIARFEARQRVAPLETVIARMGASAVPANENYIHLGLPKLNGNPVGAVTPVDDLFASGQFLDLSDDQRLSLPAFQPMMAGLRIQPAETAGFDLGACVESELQYETFVADDESLIGQRATQGLGAAALQPATVLAAGAAARSALRAATRYASEPQPIAMADASQVLARDVRTLAVASSVTREAMAYSHAADAAAAAGPSNAALQLVRLGVGY